MGLRTRVVVGGATLAVLAAALGIIDVRPSAVDWPLINADGGDDDNRRRKLRLKIRQQPPRGVDASYTHNADRKPIPAHNGVGDVIINVRPTDRVTVYVRHDVDNADLYCWIFDVETGDEIDRRHRADSGSIRCYFNRL